jgi:potassium-transporting ATPase KdpC subunit
MRLWRAAFVAVVGLMVITGLAYPLLMTGLCQLFFPNAANGSLLRRGDAVVGSRLIGQLFEDGRYFRGRPSSAGNGYDPLASGPSNLGPLSKKLQSNLQTESQAALAEGQMTPLPSDRLTGSGSGLDPDISPANAHGQVARVAKARGVREQELHALVDAHVNGRTLGLLGEPRVNVLELNLALDEIGNRAAVP